MQSVDIIIAEHPIQHKSLIEDYIKDITNKNIWDVMTAFFHDEGGKVAPWRYLHHELYGAWKPNDEAQDEGSGVVNFTVRMYYE